MTLGGRWRLCRACPQSRQPSWVRGETPTSAAGNPHETLWVQVPRRKGWPPAASESCVVTGNRGTKRRQRLLRPGASIPEETHRGGPRGLRKRGQQGNAVTAWRSPPDRGMWPRHREGPPNANGCVGDPEQKVSPEAGRSYRFRRRNRREWESPAYQGPGPWVGFPGPQGHPRNWKQQAVP